MMTTVWLCCAVIFVCKFNQHSVLSTQVHENVAICGQNFRNLDSVPPGIQQSDKSRTLSSVGEHADLWILGNRSLPRRPVRCALELTACAVCQIRISWNTSNLGTLIDEIRSGASAAESEAASHGEPLSPRESWDPMKSECMVNTGLREEPCVEIQFEEDAAGALIDGPGPYLEYNLLHNLAKLNFTSSAFKLKILLRIYWPTLQQEKFLKRLFPISIDVIDNTIIRRGRPATADLKSLKHASGYIESPRYPNAYPDAVRINYTLINEGGGPIIDSNGGELLNTQGQFGSREGRPGAVQSSGGRLELIFAANHYTQLVGFRAKYEFVEDSFWPEKPEEKSCDVLYEKSGGSITIPGNSLSINQYIDCVWIIGKSRYGSRLHDKLYVKVEKLSVETNSKGIHLEIRNGRTSNDRAVLDVWGPKSSEELAGLQPQEGFVADLRDNDIKPKGFYIRLRGYLGSYSGLVITFAQYYRWATAQCHENNEFHCANGRCIKNGLRCDQRDHCGDFSDERGCRKDQQIVAHKGIFHNLPGSTKDSHGRQVTGNLENETTFPIGSYTSIILLVSGLIGLTLVMLMVTVIVARIYRQRLIRRFTREANAAAAARHSPRSDIADVGGRGSGPAIQRVGERRFFVMPDTDVQMFEAPPAYDDALKHPSVPPNRRSVSVDSQPGSISNRGRVDSSFDNPGFSGDTEPSSSQPQSSGGPPPYPLPTIPESSQDRRSEIPDYPASSIASVSATSESETDDRSIRDDISGRLSSGSDSEDCESAAPSETSAPHPGGGTLPAATRPDRAADRSGSSTIPKSGGPLRDLT